MYLPDLVRLLSHQKTGLAISNRLKPTLEVTMTIIDKQTSRIEANERSIEANDRRLVEIHDEQQQRRREVAAAKEKLVIDIVRDAGVLDLPSREIVQALANLKVTAVGPPAIATLVPAQCEVETKAGGRDSGDLQGVTVKISSNASVANRGLLKTAGCDGTAKAGLGWPGNVRGHRAVALDLRGSRDVAPIGADSGIGRTWIGRSGAARRRCPRPRRRRRRRCVCARLGGAGRRRRSGDGGGCAAYGVNRWPGRRGGLCHRPGRHRAGAVVFDGVRGVVAAD